MGNKHDRIGNVFAIVVVLISLLILLGFYIGSTAIFYFLIAANFVCGPVCLLLYLVEVKRGVFKVKDDE